MATINLQIPEKLQRIVDANERYIVLIGGRGSAKSMSTSQILNMKCDIEGSDLLCGREFQTSIDDSVHKLNKSIIEKLGIDATPTKNSIRFASGGEIKYKGFARDPQAVKSAEGFKRSWIEEAQDLSEQSIKDLLPTIRAAGSQLFFTANPQASNDPFSKRFIVPFKHILDRDGIYRDDMHLIIFINWRDNPWHGELEQERLWDYQHLSRAEYDHTWEGAFNDSIENSIIKAEWFDAAVDAHLKLGFKARGAKVVSHDPSDSVDPRGLVYRHGNVILDVQSKEDGDVNDGCDWATEYANRVQADLFVWDGDGLGLSLRRQVADAFHGTKVSVKMFRGSEGPTHPEAIYQPDERLDRSQARKNKDSFLNKRAQNCISIRDRFFQTYRAVAKKEYIDPNELISISRDINGLEQFRSETCRVPRKPNGRGLIQIMSKEEMKSKLKISSPNLFDAAMMSEEQPTVQSKEEPQTIYIPNQNRF